MAAPRKKPVARSLTESGLWSVETGERPYTVRVREDKAPGSPVVLDYRDPKTKARRTPVARDAQGRTIRVRGERGKVDEELAALALDAGKRKSAELRLGREEEEAGPERLTASEAFRRFMDPETGGLPPSESRRRTYRAATAAWLEAVGPDTPWNRITPAIVWGVARRMKDAGKVPMAIEYVKALSAIHNWLVRKARVRGLENPVMGFDWEALQRGYEPRQERYSHAEMMALLAVRYQVDPRFALMLVLSTAAIKRNGEVRLLMRSQVDARRSIQPTARDYPYGWIWYPGMKGQDPAFHALTRAQRQALFEAMYGWDEEVADPETGGARDVWHTGYLREFERGYQAGEVPDYPLFPGGKLRKGVSQPRNRTAQQPIAHNQPREWLDEAEVLAGVESIEWRAWHGVRRGMSDLMENASDLGVVTAMGAWKNQATAEKHYLDRQRFKKMARGRVVAEALFEGAATDAADGLDALVAAARAWARGRTPKDAGELGLMGALRRLFPGGEA